MYQDDMEMVIPRQKVYVVSRVENHRDRIYDICKVCDSEQEAIDCVQRLEIEAGHRWHYRYDILKMGQLNSDLVYS